MTIIDSDHAVQFTVQPPRLTDDLALIEHTKRGVAQCTPDQRYALVWALASYDDAAQRVMVEQRVARPVAPLSARRLPSWLEIIRGVECCDPAVTRHWLVFRRWMSLACIIVGVMLILETWQKAVVIGVACVLSLGLRWSMGPKRCGQ